MYMLKKNAPGQVSRGWCETFMRWHGFALRRRTFHIIHKVSFADGDIVAMDETPLWKDISNTTVEIIGYKDVPMKSTGYEKPRVPICLTGKLD